MKHFTGTLHTIRVQLETKPYTIVVMMGGTEILGTATVATEGKIVAKVTGVFVQHGFRGGGVGQTLMERCETIARADGCDSVGLHVSASNLDVRGFYEKIGYSAVYQWDDGDLQMLKKL